MLKNTYLQIFCIALNFMIEFSLFEVRVGVEFWVEVGVDFWVEVWFASNLVK